MAKSAQQRTAGAAAAAACTSADKLYSDLISLRDLLPEGSAEAPVIAHMVSQAGAMHATLCGVVNRAETAPTK